MIIGHFQDVSRTIAKRSLTMARIWTLIVIAAVSGVIGDSVAVADAPLQHLIPETGYFDDLRVDSAYYALLRRHFSGQPYQWAQVITIPSNQSEDVVSIEGPNVASANLVHSRATRSIWEAYTKAIGPRGATGAQPDDRAVVDKIVIPIERHVATIETTLQARIVRSWVAFLRNTHYGPFADQEDDGRTYHFTAFVLHYGVIAGKTWSPPSRSLPGLFVKIGSLLGEYADARENAQPALQAKIDAALREVERQLGL